MRRVLSIVVVGTMLGCSSVPDVTFAETDASPSTDATSDTTVAVDASRPAPAYSCPDHPPPFSAGVCCGTRLCVKCNIFQCDRCQKENCSSPDVCCAKNAMTSGSSIACQSGASCN